MNNESLPLGAYIRALRDQEDMSLRELAKAIQCSPAFLSDVELGRRNPTVETLEKIANRLRVSLDDLRKHDTRPPVEDIRKRTQSDPGYAYALRKVVDSGATSEELLNLVKRIEGEENKDKRKK